MADHSSIEWTDATWNPVTGCTIVSPGCTNCYAMKLAGTRLKHHPSRAGLTIDTKAGPVWNNKVRLNEQWLDQPLCWKRPRMIFVCAHGDLFHEDVPDEWIDRVFAVMAVTPWHTYQVLTKRSARMRAYFAETWQRPAKPAFRVDDTLTVPAQPAGIDDRWHQIEHAIDTLDIPDHDRFWTQEGLLVGRPAWPRRPLPNVWLGVSVEDQARADERIPDLLATPAAIRFVSAEPLLGPIQFDDFCNGHKFIDALRGNWWHDNPDGPNPISRGHEKLDWIIVGGESGPGARPMHPDWARQIRDQCESADVPFFFKQWGEWAPGECASFAATRTERIARLWSDDWHRPKWQFGTLTPRASEEMHRDDQPDLYWLGKKRSGRKLDGVEHNGMPQIGEVPAL